VRPRYCYVVGGAYLLLAILYVVVLFVQTGHEANPFDFVFLINRPACKLLDLFPVLAKARPLPLVFSCLFAGLLQFVLIGCAIDFVISRFRES
jgi:hypothetical protein